MRRVGDAVPDADAFQQQAAAVGERQRARIGRGFFGPARFQHDDAGARLPEPQRRRPEKQNDRHDSPRTGRPAGKLAARVVFDEIVEGAWLNGEPVWFHDVYRASVPDEDDLASLRTRIVAREGVGAERYTFWESLSISRT